MAPVGTGSRFRPSGYGSPTAVREASIGSTAARRVPVSVPAWVSLTWPVAGGLGRAGTPSYRPSQPRFGALFRRSAAIRTCPTRTVPRRVPQDTWDGPLANPAVHDHRGRTNPHSDVRQVAGTPLLTRADRVARPGRRCARRCGRRRSPRDWPARSSRLTGRSACAQLAAALGV